MTPADLTPIERRLRDAYADAAATVQQHDVNPNAPARPAPRPGRPHRRLGQRLVPLAAAAAVLLVAIAAVAIPRSLDSGQQAHGRPATGPVSQLPRYLVTIRSYPYKNQPSSSPVVLEPRSDKTVRAPRTAKGGVFWALDVRNAVSGTLTAQVEAPVGDNWNALAAQGPRTFIASENDEGLMGRMTSYFYRLVIGSNGTTTSITRVGPGVNGVVAAASVTPDGRYIGYLVAIYYGKDYEDAKSLVVLADLASGKVIASWPVPATDYIASLSIDSGGKALAISAYSYNDPDASFQTQLEHGELTQWTSVLRLATSGTPIDKVPELLPEAGTLALSSDGRTLYEFLQAGNVTGGDLLDRAPVTFDLAAVDVSTGRVVSVLHTWRAVWADFQPQLALSPAGGYLLIADGASLARVSTATGQYTAVPGRVPEIPAGQGLGKFPPGQAGDIDPLAW